MEWSTLTVGQCVVGLHCEGEGRLKTIEPERKWGTKTGNKGGKTEPGVCKAELRRCGTVSGGRFAHKEEIEQLYKEKRGEEVGFVRKMLKTPL